MEPLHIVSSGFHIQYTYYNLHMTISIQMLLILVALVGGISWAAMGPPTLTHRGSIATLLIHLHLLSIVLDNQFSIIHG